MTHVCPAPVGTAVPVPYFDPRAADAEPSGNALWAVLHAIRRRWFAIGVLGIGCLWVLRDPEQQAWHDKIAGTFVIKVPRNHPL